MKVLNPKLGDVLTYINPADDLRLTCIYLGINEECNSLLYVIEDESEDDWEFSFYTAPNKDRPWWWEYAFDSRCLPFT